MEFKCISQDAFIIFSPLTNDPSPFNRRVADTAKKAGRHRSRKSSAAASAPKASHKAKPSTAVLPLKKSVAAMKRRKGKLGPAAGAVRSRCESLAVGAAARKRYDVASLKFSAWRVRSGALEPEDTNELQVLLIRYLDEMLLNGAPLHEATYAVAAVIDAHPGLGTMASLPRVKKALRGFKKLRPPRSRAPICKEIMCGLTADLMFSGQPRIGILVAMTFFA